MIRFAFIFDSRGEMTDSLPSIFHPTPDLYDKYLRVFLPYQGVCCLRWSLTYYTSSIELNVIYMFVFEINVEFLLRKSSIDPCFFLITVKMKRFYYFSLFHLKHKSHCSKLLILAGRSEWNVLIELKIRPVRGKCRDCHWEIIFLHGM